jgi:hypothetical protein
MPPVKPTGNIPIIRDDEEQRMITWRMTGKIHTTLVILCKRLNISLNYYITSRILKAIKEDTEKLDNKNKETNT